MAERLKIVQRIVAAALVLSSSGSTIQYSKYHAPGGCDPNLWTYVHSPDRLKVVDPCITVEGTVISIEQEQDGDAHVRLVPDPQYVDILDDYRFKINERDQEGALVTEPIPINGVQQDFGLYVGQRVRMTGAYVSDSWHNGWLEIHPITTVEEIK